MRASLHSIRRLLGQKFGLPPISTSPSPNNSADQLLEADSLEQNLVVLDACLKGMATQDLADLLRPVEDVNDFKDPLTGRTALMNAVIGGSIDNVKLLLEKGAALTLLDESGRSCLHWAAVVGNRAAIPILLAENKNILDSEDILGQTALFKACERGHCSTANLLLEFGADPEAEDLKGALPGDSFYSKVCQKDQSTILKILNYFIRKRKRQKRPSYTKRLYDNQQSDHKNKDVV